jgi:hypothetical protein
MVTGILFKPNNVVMYLLSLAQNESWHYAIEISLERDIIKVTSN